MNRLFRPGFALTSVCACGFALFACAEAPKYDIQTRESDFPRALNQALSEAGQGSVKEPLPDNWEAREPVMLILGLDDCFDLASEHNRALLREQLDTALARSNVLSAQAYTDPIFTLGANLNKDIDEVQSRFVGDSRTTSEETTYSANAGIELPFFTGTNVRVRHGLRRITTNSPFNSFEWSSNLNVTITQSLLDGYGTVGTRTDLDVAELEASATGGDSAQTRNLTLYSIANAYWGLVLAREDLRVLQSQLETARAALDRVKRQEAVGIERGINVLRAESTLKARERDIITAELEVARASDELLRVLNPDLLYGYLLKRSFRIAVEPKDQLSDEDLAATIYDTRDELRRAFNQRQDLVAARLRLEASGIRVANAEQGLLPQLDLEVSGELRGNGDTYDDTLSKISEADSRGVGVGLNFSMPIGNRSDRAAEERARMQREQAILNYKDAETTVITDVVGAIREIESRRRGLTAASEALTLAAAELDAVRKRSEVGLSTSFEIKQTEDDFFAAQRDVTRARVELQLAKLRLQRATGSFTPTQE